MLRGLHISQSFSDASSALAQPPQQLTVALPWCKANRQYCQLTHAHTEKASRAAHGNLRNNSNSSNSNKDTQWRHTIAASSAKAGVKAAVWLESNAPPNRVPTKYMLYMPMCTVQVCRSACLSP